MCLYLSQPWHKVAVVVSDALKEFTRILSERIAGMLFTYIVYFVTHPLIWCLLSKWTGISVQDGKMLISKREISEGYMFAVMNDCHFGDK